MLFVFSNVAMILVSDAVVFISKPDGVESASRIELLVSGVAVVICASDTGVDMLGEGTAAVKPALDVEVVVVGLCIGVV